MTTTLPIGAHARHDFTAGGRPLLARRLLSVEQFADVYHDGKIQTVRNKLSADPASMPRTFLLGRRRYITVEAAEQWLAERIAASARSGR